MSCEGKFCSVMLRNICFNCFKVFISSSRSKFPAEKLSIIRNNPTYPDCEDKTVKHLTAATMIFLCGGGGA